MAFLLAQYTIKNTVSMLNSDEWRERVSTVKYVVSFPTQGSNPHPHHFVLQLKVTPTPWPPKAMMWTTTEELRSQYCRVIILSLCSFGMCECALTMCIISGPS